MNTGAEDNVALVEKPVIRQIGEFIFNEVMHLTMIAEGELSREEVGRILTDMHIKYPNFFLNLEENDTRCIFPLQDYGVEYQTFVSVVPLQYAWLAKIRRRLLSWHWLKQSQKMLLRYQLRGDEFARLKRDPESQVMDYFGNIRAIRLKSLGDLVLSLQLVSAEFREEDNQLWLFFNEKGGYDGNG